MIVKLKKARDNHEEMKQRRALEKEALPPVTKEDAVGKPEQPFTTVIIWKN